LKETREPIHSTMRIRKVIKKDWSSKSKNANVSGSINAVVAANVNEPESNTSVSSHQRIVQRAGKTHLADEQKEGGIDEHK
jgi:hypothetical protein